MTDFFSRLFGNGLTWTYITTPFENFGWRDVLDILCISLLLFAVYLFFRDRRAGKLFTGVLLMVGVYLVSFILDLSALRHIMQSFFGYGVLAMVIIFQPELRAAMERMGSVPFRSLKTIGVESRVVSLSTGAVDAIVEAVKDMSFSKTGALIVLEQSTRIGEYIRTGTILNADLTPELLRGLFFDKAPLHDGAVIIRDGRIHAAGCYLPLSDKTDISKDLGTRHRAAIGLSEQSDAIVIAVSNETGTISIAHQGELFREFTSVSLRRRLFELLGTKQATND